LALFDDQIEEDDQIDNSTTLKLMKHIFSIHHLTNHNNNGSMALEELNCAKLLIGGFEIYLF